MKIEFYDCVDPALLRFSVIVARSEGKLVLCKHRERDTYEVPGGHIEQGESAEEAARRELYEETGAIDFTIRPVCAYSVEGKNRVNENGEKKYGMLFYAEITRFEHELHSEMERIELFDELPAALTYPEIQPALMQELNRRT
ncbi:MAG: NUDIX domain-containing protein [Clostridia bacterium]|nr:NUDIX domain-containing protein [Clostridia bacterium]